MSDRPPLLTADERQAMRQWAQITPDYEYWRENLFCALDSDEAREQQVESVIRGAHRIRCEAHETDASNAWGCPECVRELRDKLATAERERDEARADAAEWRRLANGLATDGSR